jgi:hypothetical protein
MKMKQYISAAVTSIRAETLAAFVWNFQHQQQVVMDAISAHIENVFTWLSVSHN